VRFAFIRTGHLLLAVTFGWSAAISCLAQELAPSPGDLAAPAFEELPELQASEILKPEVLKGPYHTVREPVPTSSGMNQFVVDSEFGVFPAEGNEMLLRRVKEVYAIAQLKDVSRTDQFKDSLVAAAKSPLNAAKNIVKDPVQAVSNVPKGVMKFMSRAGNTVKNIGKKEPGAEADGSKAEQLIGYSDKKRKIAVSMGIDPYSSNAVLQKELEGVAWASWAGGFTFRAATMPISGPVGIALAVTNVSGTLDKLLSEKSPAELREINRAALRAMGASAQDAERFLGNDAFSPTHSTALVLNLKSLTDVASRGAFVRLAASQSSTEADALFFVQTAALMGRIHADEMPLARIEMLGDFPVCIAKDGTVVLVLQWDYAAWTVGAASVTAEVQKLAQTTGNKAVLIALSGDASPLLKQELTQRGFTIHDRVSPGPLQ